MPNGRPQASCLRHVKSYLRDMGMADTASAWAMAERLPSQCGCGDAMLWRMPPYLTCPELTAGPSFQICVRCKSGSSNQWLLRQSKDPYVKKARLDNWRCRSAYKLLQVDERHKLFKPGDVVIDCGAAPGSWTQVAVSKVVDTSSHNPGLVIGIDLLPIQPIAGATLLDRSDFDTPEVQKRLLHILGARKVDVVLSDMAPNSSGSRHLDHERMLSLCESVLRFAVAVLPTDGDRGKMLCKLWDGASRPRFEDVLKRLFGRVRMVKPEASRSDSAEIYLLAMDFKGLPRKLTR